MDFKNQKVILANWKMNLRLGESIELAKQLKKAYKKSSKVVTGVCPSYDALPDVGTILEKTGIHLGSQDIFWQDDGAFTGEVSGPMLKELGCTFTIVGHSERRKYLNETNEMTNRKVEAALRNGMVPVLCVGETMEERSEQRHDLAVMTQVQEALNGLSLREKDRLVIAYEPVWVIGTGQAIDAEEAGRMASVVRQALIDLFPLDQITNQTSIIYGGSVDATNIKDFVDDELIQGALVGGASLDAKKFTSILKEIS